MVDHPLDRPPLRVDRDRVQHQSEDPVAVGECPKLLIGDVARVVVDAEAACVRDAHPPLVRVEALVVELRRRVRQVEHDLALREHGQQRAAEPREPALIRGAVGVRVPPVPRQPRHAQAQLPEDVGTPELVAERLDALEREHQADPLAALDEIEVGSSPHRHDSIRIFAHGAMERGGLAERIP